MHDSAICRMRDSIASTLRVAPLLAWLVVLFAASTLWAGDNAIEFRRDVLPVLRAHCFKCHEGAEPKAGVRLDLRAELLGRTGYEPLVVIGNSRVSRLIQVVKAAASGDPSSLRMPPEGPPLSEKQIAILRRWIDAGLSWDVSILPEREGGADHWAFQPVRRPQLPIVPGDAWSSNAIDRFITHKHHERSLSPAPPASRRALVRRLFLDLWGLPPTPEAIEEFTADSRPNAVEQWIDQLLSVPAYGERWGRHWLDVARWAESEGFESNHPRPFAWRYRDYVTQAFSDDKPFDEFVRQQVAGDELADYCDENLIATGFLAAARISSNEEDKWLQRNDVTVDIVNAVGSGLLGLSLHCAQCHDHKFDPITSRDYYSLHAFFARGLPLNVRLREEHYPPQYDQVIKLQQAIFEEARQRTIAEMQASLPAEDRAVLAIPAERRTVEQELSARRLVIRMQPSQGAVERRIAPADRKLYEELKKRAGELAREATPPQTFAFYSPVTSPHKMDVLPSVGFYPLPYEPAELARTKTYVMMRGEVHQIGPGVSPTIPAVLRAASQARAAGEAKRADLARWLTHRDNPLLARVWVNRIWQQHFGTGLVATADDFGVRGARPSHPELLDWLAAELMDRGWSTKHIHRLILSSATYQQSAQASPRSHEHDRENRFLSRWLPRRLEAEPLRDAMLAVSGDLDGSVGGPSVPVEQRESSRRRSLYLFQRRGNPPEMQGLFDGPAECAASIAARHVATSSLQSLYLLNSDFSWRCAQTLAARICHDASDAEQIQEAFRRVLLREPTAEEWAAARRLWQIHAGESLEAASPLELLCQALLNLNEFVYVE
jgi:hypothetical protein